MKYSRAVRPVVVCAFLCALCVVVAGATGVSQLRLMSHVRFLASEELEGRETGERGDAIAERYVETRFRQAGLSTVPGRDGYRQPFTVLRAEVDPDLTSLAVESGAERHLYHINREIFYSHTGFSDVTVRAPVVFAGFGITAPEYGYDDYARVDVKGKIVVVFNHEPGEKSGGELFRGRRPTKYSNPQVKAAIAKARGAVGMIVIQDAANHEEDIDVAIRRRQGESGSKPYLGLAGSAAGIPVFYATAPVVEQLFRTGDIDPLERQRTIDERMKPASAPISRTTVELNVRLKRVERLTVSNIVGMIEGSDPALRDEYIVIGAHHDHVGMDGSGGVFCGADDNASGTAGLLEAARVLRDAELGRSVLFVSFCGEEEGTLGSTWFVEHPPVEGIRCAVNLDMIGRNNMDKDENGNMFIVYTSAQTPALERLVRAKAAAQEETDVRVAPYVRFFGASDHKVFHAAGIPVVFYFSGFHQDYHTVNDTADRIVPGKLVAVVSHLCSLIPELSRIAGEELLFDRAITEEPPKDEYERPF